jgi:hypothetical protein
LVRNISNNAIVNIDTDGFNSYINTRKRISSQTNKIYGLEEQVSILSSEIGKIKSLLEKINK